MTGPPITVNLNTPIGDVMKSLEENRIVRVPVTDQDKLVGIISRRDVFGQSWSRSSSPSAISSVSTPPSPPPAHSDIPL